MLSTKHPKDKVFVPEPLEWGVSSRKRGFAWPDPPALALLSRGVWHENGDAEECLVEFS